MTRPIAAALSFAVLAWLAQAAVAAAPQKPDAANGKRLAERWCASCHVVDAGQQRGNTQAAPFSEVAKRPQLDASALALFLLNPHPKMPDMNLSRKEAADLAAYILSLK